MERRNVDVELRCNITPILRNMSSLYLSFFAHKATQQREHQASDLIRWVLGSLANARW